MKNNKQPNETAYYNGTIYTADDMKPTARAFLVRDGRFVAVGNDEDVKDCPVRVDLKGKCVVPGFVDSHCHAFAGITKAAAGFLFLDPRTKPEDLGEALVSLTEEEEDSQAGPLLVMGIQLTQGAFEAKDIDRVINDRPVLIFSDDGHALLLNSKAMEVLGIDRDTEDPGRESYFQRDPQGNPTGLVIEIPAMMRCQSLVDDAVTGDAELEEIIEDILNAYANYGYTTIFEAMSADDDETRTFKVLKEMDRKGTLTLRISASFGYHGESILSAEEAMACLKILRDQFSSDHLHPDTLKLFTDGTIEDHTALLHEPYADSPDYSGIPATDPDELKMAARMAAEEGFNIHIHAIGDGAVCLALDTLCSLDPGSGTKTIAHNQLYSGEEVERIIAEKDIFFQTTPHWATSDDYTESFLGKERFRKQFPVGTMFRHGVTVSFGSDSCLEPETASPFLGMYYAEARGDHTLCHQCYPPLSEGIDRWSSLLAYTINGAKQLGLDQETGSITKGKSADFLILDRDIMTCSLEELKDTKVETTFFCGQQQKTRAS